MSRVYTEPSVKLITCTDPITGYILWSKSRPGIVINDYDNNSVNVGGEVLPLDEYKERVFKMGLQYTLFPSFTLQITGSILFRDILFTLNRCPQWATSLRFLNSTYDKFDESNYKISNEYKGIKEWEDQFTKYMDKIKETMVTDENRVEMPYSISSTYWIQIPFKTLVTFMSYMIMKLPFFYKVYGRKIEEVIKNEVDLDITKYYVDYIDSSIDQYRLKSEGEESTYTDGDFTIMSSKMGLLLYSQFIRQQDTTVSGLYNMLEHKSINEFKHKVFYAQTEVKFKCCTSVSRFNRTLSNRTCWFSMSSGKSINSWSNIIDPLIKDMSVEEFRNVLPCKVEDDRIQCKYWDDTKFRLNSVEKRNLPCGIACMNSKVCKDRFEYDNTELSYKYLEVENLLESEGVKPVDSDMVEDFNKRY